MGGGDGRSSILHALGKKSERKLCEYKTIINKLAMQGNNTDL